MRIVNPKRFILSLAILFLLSALCLNMVFSLVASDSRELSDWINHRVVRGETVWEIAKQYNAGDDIRDFVTVIALENNLSNFVIVPGQVLRIPVLPQ